MPTQRTIRFQKLVVTRLSARSVDQLLFVMFTNLAYQFRDGDVWEPAPAAGVETEDVLEIGATFDLFVHHLGKCRTVSGVDFARPRVTELTDDFDAVFRRPPADVILLDCE